MREDGFHYFLFRLQFEYSDSFTQLLDFDIFVKHLVAI